MFKLKLVFVVLVSATSILGASVPQSDEALEEWDEPILESAEMESAVQDGGSHILPNDVGVSTPELGTNAPLETGIAFTPESSGIIEDGDFPDQESPMASVVPVAQPSGADLAAIEASEKAEISEILSDGFLDEMVSDSGDILDEFQESNGTNGTDAPFEVDVVEVVFFDSPTPSNKTNPNTAHGASPDDTKGTTVPIVLETMPIRHPIPEVEVVEAPNPKQAFESVRHEADQDRPAPIGKPLALSPGADDVKILAGFPGLVNLNIEIDRATTKATEADLIFALAERGGSKEAAEARNSLISQVKILSTIKADKSSAEVALNEKLQEIEYELVKLKSNFANEEIAIQQSVAKAEAQIAAKVDTAEQEVANTASEFKEITSEAEEVAQEAMAGRDRKLATLAAERIDVIKAYEPLLAEAQDREKAGATGTSITHIKNLADLTKELNTKLDALESAAEVVRNEFKEELAADSAVTTKADQVLGAVKADSKDTEDAQFKKLQDFKTLEHFKLIAAQENFDRKKQELVDAAVKMKHEFETGTERVLFEKVANVANTIETMAKKFEALGRVR